MNNNDKNYNAAGIFISLVFGSIITVLVSTIMTAAIPSVMVDFNIPPNQAQLVTSIYSLVSGIMMLLTAFIVKKYPTKRLFLTGMAIFGLGSLCCALFAAILSSGVTDQNYTIANIHTTYAWMSVFAAATVVMAIFLIPNRKKN